MDRIPPNEWSAPLGGGELEDPNPPDPLAGYAIQPVMSARQRRLERVAQQRYDRQTMRMFRRGNNDRNYYLAHADRLADDYPPDWAVREDRAQRAALGRPQRYRDPDSFQAATRQHRGPGAWSSVDPWNRGMSSRGRFASEETREMGVNLASPYRIYAGDYQPGNWDDQAGPFNLHRAPGGPLNWLPPDVHEGQGRYRRVRRVRFQRTRRAYKKRC
jgi:hypothetical protein